MAKRITEGGETRKVKTRGGNTGPERENFPWTRGPDTTARKVARALWG